MERWLRKNHYEPHNPSKPKRTWPFDTAMHAAARQENPKYLRWLGEMADIDVNQLDWHGATPAHIAVELGHTECFKWLVKHGGVRSLRVENRYGNTPLQIAIVKGHVDICKWVDEIGVLRPRAERNQKGGRSKKAPQSDKGGGQAQAGH
jgi:hypothetical protein